MVISIYDEAISVSPSCWYRFLTTHIIYLRFACITVLCKNIKRCFESSTVLD